ncbi:hypothetical protein TCAL_07126 [Tigriopus californicus]|uniref:Arginine-glutamic acid dipeptide repeats protein n=2 Tax=Tigriopus californicus TaxID=6832 RepID=A0A553PCX9_TIGCA|nr:hypothetical protein TCAL_07126 [Tigriopus californicus]
MSRANRPEEPDSAEASPKNHHHHHSDHGHGGESSAASPADDAMTGGKEDEDETESKTHEDEDEEGRRRGRLAKEGGEDELEEEGEEGEGGDDDNGEIVEMNVGKRPYHGKVWKKAGNGEVMKYHCLTHAKDYTPGEAVYIESQRPDQPYYICQIQDLKMSKRDTLMVHIKWFYRTSEVPEQVYQLLIQDRHIESAGSRRLMNESMYRTRELFISEMTDIYPASVLRGKCVVHHCMDLKALKEFHPEEDVFFYTLSYNPETRRLASTQGEIRVGASHQAKLPEYKGQVPIERRPEPWGEEIAWCPERIHDHDLLMFLRAARSMAAFAAMCDGGSPEEGISAASRDGITAQAIRTLHECDYDTGKALQSLLKTPFPEDIFRRWHEEEVKCFIKGLRLHGKNFFKIRAEFLPEKDTAELIEFYYFWKKTTGAANNRPRGRRHRPAVMRRIKGGKGATKSMKDDPTDLSSCSEAEDNDKVEVKKDPDEMSPYYCRHCFTTSSKDWHHGGKEKLLLCAECRIYFKRYAELPNLEGHKFIEDEEDEPEIEEPLAVKKEEPQSPPHAPTPLLDDTSKDELNLNAIEEDSKEPLGLSGVSLPTDPVDLKAEPPQPALGNLKSPIPTLGGASQPGHSRPLPTGLHHVTPQQPPQPQPQSQPQPQLPQQHQPPPPTSLLMQPQHPPPPSQQSQHVPHQQPIQQHQPTTPQHQPPPSQPLQQPQQHLQQQIQQQQQQQQQVPQQLMQPQLQQPQQQQQHPPPPAAHTNTDIQVLGERAAARSPATPGTAPPPPAHHSALSAPPPPPRKDTPPPKPDGSECHRSQSAIFTRMWNRGEGNSCSRTDMIFKPVPDSKLARKREERIRKANEREEALKVESVKRSHMEMQGMHSPHHPLFSPNDPYGKGPPHHRPSPFPPGHPMSAEMERRDHELRMSLGAPPVSRASMYPPGFGPAPPPSPHQGLMQAAAAENRRFEEMAARASAERQYAERMNALATDPLVRLQMAGVTPEMPGPFHPSHYGPLGPLTSSAGLSRPPNGLDQRFRSPADMLMRPGGYHHHLPPSHEMLQRQLLMEREHSIIAAHQSVAAAAHMAQQEELFRMEQARAAAASRQ